MCWVVWKVWWALDVCISQLTLDLDAMVVSTMNTVDDILHKGINNQEYNVMSR